jgi:phage N-6-adenine-methyltransferase
MGAPTPATSKQDYGTPRAFLDAVERRWGPIAVDLAAHAGNAVCADYVTAEDDSLSLPWAELLDGGLGWLNPPYKRIDPWAEKCAAEAAKGARLLFFVPASVGSNWFWDHCARFAARPISPRVVFDGTPPDPRTGKPPPFMKDLMLVEFGPDVPRVFERWQWAKL